MAIKFPWTKKDKKEVEQPKVEEKIEDVVDEVYDKVEEVFQSDELAAYVIGAENEFEQIQQKIGTSTEKSIDIDEILNNLLEIEKKRFSASCPSNMIETYDLELEQAARQLHAYLQTNDINALMEQYRNTDYVKYSIIDLEQHLINEPNSFIKKACREEQYSDQVVNAMYKKGSDIYEINKRVFGGVTSPDKGEWLVTRLMQQNAIENAYFTSEKKKIEVLERAQISMNSSQTGLPTIDVDNAIKEVASKDFDRGYWVQTEIDMLTLPLEQKQAIRNFRDQNQKEGNYFEPGTIVNQYTESTGKRLEGGAKK